MLDRQESNRTSSQVVPDHLRQVLCNATRWPVRGKVPRDEPLDDWEGCEKFLADGRCRHRPPSTPTPLPGQRSQDGTLAPRREVAPCPPPKVAPRAIARCPQQEGQPPRRGNSAHPRSHRNAAWRAARLHRDSVEHHISLPCRLAALSVNCRRCHGLGGMRPLRDSSDGACRAAQGRAQAGGRCREPFTASALAGRASRHYTPTPRGMTRRGPENVGILAAEVYFPTTFVDQSELGTPPPLPREGL